MLNCCYTYFILVPRFDPDYGNNLFCHITPKQTETLHGTLAFTLDSLKLDARKRSRQASHSSLLVMLVIKT